MNSLDEASSSMNLGGGEDKQEDQEPEQEKGNSDSTDNSAVEEMQHNIYTADELMDLVTTGGGMSNQELYRLTNLLQIEVDRRLASDL